MAWHSPSGLMTTAQPLPAIWVGASAVAGYQGPLDIYGSTGRAWGVRAMSSAARGTKAIRVQRSSDSTQADILTDATTGVIVNGGFLDGSTYNVVTVYNQGTGGSSFDFPVAVGNLLLVFDSGVPSFLGNGGYS